VREYYRWSGWVATGTSAIIGACLGVFAYASGNLRFAEYLNIMYIPNLGELSVFIGALIGACVGFLWYNAYPAQVFMGDTGSFNAGGSYRCIGHHCAERIADTHFLRRVPGGNIECNNTSELFQIHKEEVRGRKKNILNESASSSLSKIRLPRVQDRNPVLDRNDTLYCVLPL
jgi:hypothetical protein